MANHEVESGAALQAAARFIEFLQILADQGDTQTQVAARVKGTMSYRCCFSTCPEGQRTPQGDE